MKLVEKIKENLKLSIGLTFIAAVIIVGIFVFLLIFFGKTEKTKPTGQSLKVKDNKTESVGAYTPTIEGKITGDYNNNEAICRWYMGETMIKDTKPVDGKCVLNDIGLIYSGEYPISYRIIGSDYISDPIIIKIK